VEIVTYGPTAFIPTIESVFETIMRIKDIRYFSIIDLRSGCVTRRCSPLRRRCTFSDLSEKVLSKP
jgi:hypothetical protein